MFVFFTKKNELSCKYIHYKNLFFNKQPYLLNNNNIFALYYMYHLKMKESYITIDEEGFAEIREKASKFLAYAFPVTNNDEIRAALESIVRLHPKATHHCYAYRLGIDGNNYRANDDGEPSGTAGRPILGQIDSAGLTDVLVVVVRYFGGTKLGTSGLIQTYKESAQEVLAAIPHIEKKIQIGIKTKINYARSGDAIHIIKSLEGTVTDEDYSENEVTYTIRIPLANRDILPVRLKALVGNMTLDEAASTPFVDGLEIELL